MQLINTSQIIVVITLLCAFANNPVFGIPTPGGIQAIAARQDGDLPVEIIGSRTIRPAKPTITTKSVRPLPTKCGPNMKRQEGDTADGLKIVPVCD